MNIKEITNEELSKAKEFVKFIEEPLNNVICTSHPSPRGADIGHSAFLGSRIFSKTNAMLVDMVREPVDWRLP